MQVPEDLFEEELSKAMLSFVGQLHVAQAPREISAGLCRVRKVSTAAPEHRPSPGLLDQGADPLLTTVLIARASPAISTKSDEAEALARRIKREGGCPPCDC